MSKYSQPLMDAVLRQINGPDGKQFENYFREALATSLYAMVHDPKSDEILVQKGRCQALGEIVDLFDHSKEAYRVATNRNR